LKAIAAVLVQQQQQQMQMKAQGNGQTSLPPEAGGLNGQGIMVGGPTQ